jgi:hypothetical protein
VSLLCRLGRHRPRGIPRWNDGFYFATCERCGRDLVRTAFQRWHVPRGYRIVWSDRPPSDRPDVTLRPEASGAGPETPAQPAPESAAEPVPATPAPEAIVDGAREPEPESAAIADEAAEPKAADVPSARSDAGRLPIQDVLAQLHAEDAAERSRETAPPPVEAPTRQRRSNWDFMDEESLPADPVPGPASSRTAERSPGPADSSPAAPPNAPVDGRSRRVGGLPGKWRSAQSAMRSFFSGPAEPNPALVIALALAVAVALAAALAMYGARTSSPGFAPPPRPGAAEAGETADPFAADPDDRGDPRQASADSTSSRGDRAYVAASLLSCREAPVRQARRIRNLGRGQEVRILGIDGEWASLAYRGGQCWARAQFISPVPPLR